MVDSPVSTIAKEKSAPGVPAGVWLYRVAQRLRDGLYALFNVWFVGEHVLTGNAPDVGYVDVDREPWHVEHEKVDGRAAVERQLVLEGGVALHLVQEVEQALYLIHGPWLEFVGAHDVHERISSSASGRQSLQ